MASQTTHRRSQVEAAARAKREQQVDRVIEALRKADLHIVRRTSRYATELPQDETVRNAIRGAL